MAYLPPPPSPPPKDLHPSSASICEDDPQIIGHIQDKIRYAFENLQVKDPSGWLIQFWAPLKIASRWILTTSDQPFLLHFYFDKLKKHRSCCEKYKYNIDDVDYKVAVEIDSTNTIISSGTPATAFLNRMPEYHLVEMVDLMSPLESSALECGLMYSFVLPVFYPSQTCCVGVVQCSTTSAYHLLHAFNKLNVELEKEGFKTFDARQHLPYKTICGLQHAKDEIDEASKIISQTLHLSFAQVWIVYEDTQTKQMIGLKLTSNCNMMDNKDLYLDLAAYTDACDKIPLKFGEGIFGSTLENYQPHFIKNPSKLSHIKAQRLLSFYFEGSNFVIYLKSTKTRDLDYVFEFIWSKTRNNFIMFESLILSLKTCMSSFKLASGAELGDELRILDVENSTENELKYIEIFQKSKILATPTKGRRPEVGECLTPLKAKCKTTPIPLSLEDIQPQFGKTMIEAAKDLNVSLSTLKRKCKALGISEWHGKSKRNVKHSYKNQSNTNEEEDKGGAIEYPSANNKATYLDENTVTIKAEYADDMIKFHIPISSATFVAIEKEISNSFKLNPSDYKVKYLDEDDDWILLSSDKDMRACIQNHRNLNITTIKMQVLQRQI